MRKIFDIAENPEFYLGVFCLFSEVDLLPYREAKLF